MKKSWFRAKQYGWGWQPATWQGYLVLGVFALFVFGNALRLGIDESADDKTVYTFLLQTLVVVVALVGVCYRTGEKPRWQWGKKKWHSANDELNKDV